MGPIYRQGDVLIVKLSDAPKLGVLVKRDAGRIVLAYGEVTGHAHAIKSRSATLFMTPDGTKDGDEAWTNAQRFLVVKRAVNLSHEEHATITLPPGNYRVIQQREYSPEAIRNVAD